MSALAELEAELAENDIETLGISGATGKGTEQLLRTMLSAVTQVVAEEKSGKTEPGPSDSERQQA